MNPGRAPSPDPDPAREERTRMPLQVGRGWHGRPGRAIAPTTRPDYSTITRSPALRPNVSGAYISSAFAGGTTKFPGVVARAM